MRLFLVALAASLLFSTVAVADDLGCPLLTPIQAQRAAQEAQSPAGAPIAAISLGGVKEYCRSEPQAVLCAGGGGTEPTLADVQAADAALRSTFGYRSDFVNYGLDDLWRSPVTCGDCEDYALSVADRLHAVGFGGRYMRLSVMTTSPTLAHATLLVETSDAGVVEVSVGFQGEPSPIRTAPNITRYGSMLLDGQRRWKAAPGFVVKGQTIAPVRR